jgi:N-acetylmuramoyl-L-alanine amidase
MVCPQIKERLLPVDTIGRPGRQSAKRYIVIHESDCTLPGADALAHARYFAGLCRAGVTALSYHYVVDATQVIRLIPDKECSCHAGDGMGLHSANLRGISVLLCVNSDADPAETRKRAAGLVAHLLIEHSLGLDAVHQHYDFGGKDCPHSLRLGGAWGRFIDQCEAAYTEQSERRRRCLESFACPWYKVQICASRDHDEALKLACELREKGYTAYVVADIDYGRLLGESPS